MGLTWDEFLKLTTVIYNLALPIDDFISEEIEIGETNRFKTKSSKTVCSSRTILKYENGRIKNC